jgi:hypothetical protein
MVMAQFLHENERFVFVQRIGPQCAMSRMAAAPFDTLLRIANEVRGLELDSVREHGLDWSTSEQYGLASANPVCFCLCAILFRGAQ